MCYQIAFTNEGYRLVNGILPVYFMGALLLPASRLIRRVPESIWAPAAWLPISFAVFYGFGPLVTVYGNSATIQAMDATLLAVSQAQVFKANFLSVTGVISVTAGFWLAERLRAHSIRPHPISMVNRLNIKPSSLALVFVFFGLLLRHGILKPIEWGSLSAVVPGVIGALGPLADVGFGLLAFSMIVNRRRILYQIFWLTWPIHLFLCLLSLSKAEIIVAMLLPALGAFMAHRDRNRLFINIAIMVLVFSLSQSWVNYGRGMIASESGTISQAGYGTRVDLLGNYLSGERMPTVRHESLQDWWTRLNFSHVQAYAMEQYESGMPGSTLSNVWMYFIPRLVWPDKPALEGPGKIFYSLVTGREGTSFLALSVFGDLYWQFGWLGVILVCPLIGWFFSVISFRSVTIMKDRYFIMMPVVLLALNTALLGMNKYLINGIIAVIPVYYGYIFLISISAMLIGRFLKR